MARGWHYAKLSLSNPRRLSFPGMCILLFLFLSLCRFCLFVFLKKNQNAPSLVQVAEQAHPLVQRCPSPNPMREHRNNRTHEEVVVGGGATPHG